MNLRITSLEIFAQWIIISLIFTQEWTAHSCGLGCYHLLEEALGGLQVMAWNASMLRAGWTLGFHLNYLHIINLQTDI
jgi:hypothetical protein